MSKFSLFVLMTTVVAILVGLAFELPFTAGVSGALLVIALGYSYVVAKREVELLAYAASQEDEGRDTVEPPKVPQSIA